ncbi:uncharacterized protein DUF4249 [Algoriphagus ratkowskyi]|uniref:DUF4249 domain-containing protein n=1 Tax=Algoriphagus ratkowskyi TaxID=57028 RepID=A0A2W7R8R7_9BACT|nr:DUF4249 family protein [Algoriphagus ratkowskyi]PZX50629.1 uncharacterized protein DUF4249 [Algoriphagus ratkowskyi]TXD79989.1 DUF4249 domain-containing protein [Algoriphagus ratkowskyi]
MNRLGIILLALLSFSCQEEVNLPLAMIDDDVPVIEAIWTDNAFYNEVSISLARNYFDAIETNVIADANVYITIPGTTRRIPFEFNNNTQSYLPVRIDEVAKVGVTYQLNVFWDDNEFVSSGILLAPPTVDSVTYEYKEERLFRDEGYYIKVYGEIPFETDNYYRIKVIENDTLKNNRDDYLLFDDTFGLKFFSDGLELNYSFEIGDKVRLELFRMNESSFKYLSQLVNLLYNDGGLFSPPPQNPDSNIQVVNGNSAILGYFNVTSVLARTVKIEAKPE